MLALGAQSNRPKPFPETKSKTKRFRGPLPLFPVRTIWSLALNNQLTVPPAYDATRAYFPIEGDRLVAYDLKSGIQEWIVSATLIQQPAAGDGLIFFAEPDHLTALHASDGSVAWQLPFADKLAVHPVWDNGWLVVATASGNVLAYRATDGQLIWQRDVGSPAHAAPALAADRVYIPTEGGRVVSLMVESGRPAWERRLGGRPNEILALDERLYVGANDNFFYCLRAEDGRVDWRWHAGGDVIGLPAVDEGRVYVVSLDNVVRALSRGNGSQRWIRMLPLRPSSGPIQVGATILVAGISPPLRAFNAKDGTPAGDLAPSAPVTASSAAAPATASAGPAEVAAAPHAFVDPDTGMPLLLVLTRDIALGAAATLVTRSFDPTAAAFAPLPNPTTTVPMLPRSTQ